MKDSTTPQDGKAMTPASAGSVAGRRAADCDWFCISPDGVSLFPFDDEGEAVRYGDQTGMRVACVASARPVRPGYILGDHWLEVAYERICAGDREEEVMDDYGWVRLTREERDAIWMVAEAYGENDGDPECERFARIMHGLWQRTK